MDDYRKLAHQRFLEKQKIEEEKKRLEDKEQLEKDELLKKDLEEKIKLEQEKREKELRNKMIVLQEISIIQDIISSFDLDKSDDNINMILTVINGCIENIKEIWTSEDLNTIRDCVIAFSNAIDSSEIKRPKGINTIANVKILEDGFKKIFDSLNLDVEIKTLDTDGDQDYAKKIFDELNPKYKPDNEIPNIIDVDELPDDIYQRDVDFAMRLQEELNEPKNKKNKKTVVSKYNGLNSDDLIKKLLNEKA